MNKINLILVFIFINTVLTAQVNAIFEPDPVPIRLQGKIISMGDNIPVPYAHIINNRTHSGTTSNAGGFFTLEMLNIDSIVVSSMGYFTESFNIPYNYNQDSIFIIKIRPIRFSIGEVTIEGERIKANTDALPEGQVSDIDLELRGDAFNEKPPVLAALFNPLSFMQYYMSNKEKEKRKVREAMLLEQYWELHSQNYNKEIVMSLTGLNETEADDFMIWFNSLSVLPYTATEYEVRAAIKNYFEIYKLENGIR